MEGEATMGNMLGKLLQNEYDNREKEIIDLKAKLQDKDLLLEKATKYIQQTFDKGYYSSDDKVYVQLLLGMLREVVL